jgi:nicotinamidase-related amidase
MPGATGSSLQRSRSTGRTKLFVAGVSTEVCVAFVALAALRDGYEVYAVIDASGTWSKLIADSECSGWFRQALCP